MSRVEEEVTGANRCVVEEEDEEEEEKYGIWKYGKRGQRRDDEDGGKEGMKGNSGDVMKQWRAARNIKEDRGAVWFIPHLSHSLGSQERGRRPARQSLQRS